MYDGFTYRALSSLHFNSTKTNRTIFDVQIDDNESACVCVPGQAIIIYPVTFLKRYYLSIVQLPLFSSSTASYMWKKIEIRNVNMLGVVELSHMFEIWNAEQKNKNESTPIIRLIR